MRPEDRIKWALSHAGLIWQRGISFGVTCGERNEEGDRLVLVPETIAHELGHLWHLDAGLKLPMRPNALGEYIDTLPNGRRKQSEVEARATNYLVGKILGREDIQPWIGEHTPDGRDKPMDLAVLAQKNDPKTQEVARRVVILLRETVPSLKKR